MHNNNCKQQHYSNSFNEINNITATVSTKSTTTSTKSHNAKNNTSIVTTTSTDSCNNTTTTHTAVSNNNSTGNRNTTLESTSVCLAPTSNRKTPSTKPPLVIRATLGCLSEVERMKKGMAKVSKMKKSQSAERDR